MFEVPTYLLALLAALFFSLCNHFQSRGVLKLSVKEGGLLVVATSTVLIWLLAPFFLDARLLTHPATLYFVGVGLFLPAVSMSLSIMGVRFLGPTLQSSFSSLGPVLAAIVGVSFFGEDLTAELAIGIAGIVLAALVLNSVRVETKSWPLWAVLFPMAAILLRTAGQAVTKLGLEQVNDPYWAALVGNTVSALVLLSLALSRGPGQLPSLRQPAALQFCFAGAAMSAGLLLFTIALYRGDLIEVVPLLATSPIFSVILNVLVFKHERFNRKSLFSVALVAGSVFLIASANG